MSVNLERIATETRNPATMGLDKMTPLELITEMNCEDARVPAAITPQLPQIAKCI